VDGNSGTVILEPDEETVASYRKLRAAQEKRRTEMLRAAALPAITRDGHGIKVMANMELLEEVVAVLDHGAEGVGLYRTEFTYLNSESLPQEEDLYREYREVAEILHPLPLIIRTLDLGGEKVIGEMVRPGARNPALGLRSIRLSLKFHELFLSQLKAILRAGAGLKNVMLMFPMISGVMELREAKRVLGQARAELQKEGVDFDPRMRLGTMIEVPSAVMVAHHLAREVDFMNIGTNDLIQYSLAIDRVNEDVAHLYEPLHPGVLKMIDLVVRAAQESGVEVGICGEMAGEPEYSPILLGLGLDFISMNPISVPSVKRIIRSSSYKGAQGLLGKLMSFETAIEVEEHLTRVLAEEYPEDFPGNRVLGN
jgi:phosphotransferase system enzyme I (PtsI)